MSIPGLSFDSWISLSEETAWGDGGTPGNAGYARVHSDTLKLDYVINPVTNVLSGVSTRRVSEGPKRVLGTIVPEFLYEGVPVVLLKHTLGHLVTTANTPEAGAHTHVFDTDENADTLPEGLAIESCKGNIPAGKVFLYDGCMVDQMRLIFEPEDFVRMECDILGRTETPNTTASGTPAYATDIPVEYHHAGTLTLAGSTLPITSGRIVINNFLSRDRFLMSQTVSQLCRTRKREVTGSFMAEFTDLTHYNKYRDLTAGTMGITFSAGTIPATSTAYSVAIAMGEVYLTGSTPEVTNEGIVEVEYGFRAVDPGAGAGELALTVVNGESSIP